MCFICRMIPCHPRCPNATDEGVYKCEWCGNPICDGDQYLETVKGKICSWCIEDMTSRELMEVMDLSYETAQEDDYGE